MKTSSILFGIVVLPLLVSLLLYYKSLDGGYVWDDRAAIVSNKDVSGENPMWNVLFNDFWGQSISLSDSHKSFRPLTTLSFRFNHFLHGYNAFGFHLGNILIYSLSVSVFYLFLMDWFDFRVSFIASIVFLFHPIHVESVSSLVGRADALSGLFFLLSLLFYTKSINRNSVFFLGLAMIACILSSLSKEVGITVLAICLFLEYQTIVSRLIDASKKDLSMRSIFQKSIGKLFERNCMLRCSVVLSTLITFMVIRVLWNGSSTLYQWSVLENHINLLPSYLDRVMSYGQSHFWYFWKLCYPRYLCFDYGYACIPTIHSWTDVRNLLPLIVYGLIGVLFSQGVFVARSPKAMGVILLVIPWIPASNIFFPVGTILAERLLFVPSMGFSLLFASFWTETCAPMWIYLKYQLGRSTGYTFKQAHAVLPFLFLLPLLLFWGAIVHQRSLDWNDELQIYRSALTVCPDSIKAMSNFAALTTDNPLELTMAASLSKRSILLYSNATMAKSNYALASLKLNHYVEAIYYYEQALQGSGANGKSLHYLSNALWAFSSTVATPEQRYLEDRASQLLAIAQQQGYLSPSMLHAKASLAMEKGEYSEALPVLFEALRLYEIKSKEVFAKEFNLDVSKTYNQLGSCYLALHDDNKAIEMFEKAIRFNPELVAPYANLGSLYRSQSRYQEAKELLKSAIQLSKTVSPALLNNLGLIYQDEGHYGEAYRLFHEAWVLLMAESQRQQLSEGQFSSSINGPDGQIRVIRNQDSHTPTPLELIEQNMLNAKAMMSSS